MKRHLMAIVLLWLEKSPIVCQIEIEAQAALAACSLETNQKWKHQELWLKT